MKTRHLIATFLLPLLVPGAHAALPDNPGIPDYAGYQPDLVQGTEKGLATGRPKIRHVYLAAPDVLAITLDAQSIPFPILEKFELLPTDKIDERGAQAYGQEGAKFFANRNVIRDGKVIGRILGPKQDHFMPVTALEGETLDLAWADAPASYALSSKGDPNFAEGVAPMKVFRKSVPETSANVEGKQVVALRHFLYLKLPQALKPGTSYQLDFKKNARIGPGSGVKFTFDDTRLRSEALHVNLLGHHPKDAEKIALAFEWLGSGGGADLSTYKTFNLVENVTGQVVFTGDIKLLRPAASAEVLSKLTRTSDDLPMTLRALDYSSFNTPGVYRITVPGLGSSFPFRIDESVWADAAFTSAKGIYNHRSGIELGPPHTKFVRPRNLHPADGFVVHRTDPKIFNDKARFGDEMAGWNAFERIQASILEGTSVPEAWGGWHDAADFDRSLLPQEHNLGVHALLDLYESNPAYYEKLNLNIPESGNYIPDVIDEALWCSELFRRIQQPDGGIPSNVESIEHPPLGPSWLLTQPTAISPPTPQTCHIYVSMAAQMSRALAKYDPALAEKYKESALRAMDWADKNADVPNLYRKVTPPELQAARANLALYQLTDDPKWHDRFKTALPKIKPDEAFPAQATYALLPAEKADPELQAKSKASVLAAADDLVQRTATRNFGVDPSGAWRFRMGQPEELIVAHRLTQDPRYLLALERMAQFSLGLNPQNASYATGLGARQVLPFHIDSPVSGQPPPEGITAWGPIIPNRNRAAAIPATMTGIHPAWSKWPWAEGFFNIRDYRITEYTVTTNMAYILLMRSYLAQNRSPR